MQDSAQSQLPQAHIIASANDTNHGKLFIVLIIVFVILFLLGVGGFIAYNMYQKNALEAKLLQSIQNASPIPTVGIPIATKIPTHTLAPSPTSIATSTATPSSTPILTP